MPVYEGQFITTSGPVYHVDPDAGSASGTGLDYGEAMGTFALAITAGGVWQALQDNVYSRYTILIYGASTFVPAVTTLPQYCDIIGIGANPRGNGTGIARIGDNGASGTVDAIAGTTRGTYWRNIQFGNNAGTYSADFVHVFRSMFENCAFHPGSDYDGSVAATLGAVRVSGNAGGLHMKNCAFGGDSNMKGFGLTFDGAVANNCVIEDCFIGGVTACVRINSAACNTTGTTFRKNNIGTNSASGATSALGVDDNATDGLARYDGNWVFATDAFSMTAGAYRMVGNHVVNDTTGAMELVGT